MSVIPKGYVLEKPRVGTGNSPFTFTPDNVIVNGGAYSAAFGSNEASPGRTEYLVLTEAGGDLPYAEFGWTKNEGIQRFDFDTGLQRFAPLPGGPIPRIAVVGPTLNTTRVKITKPTVALASAPYRLYTEGGFQFTLVSVQDDSSFGSPSAGTVEYSATSGSLNWAVADLTTYTGQEVYFQQQGFFAFKDSSGNIGIATQAQLNPLPLTGQFPRIRLGYGSYLTPVEVATDGAFSVNPIEGTVEWSRATGKLKFNTTDLLTASIAYYDGVLFGTRLRLNRQTLGLVPSPSIPTIASPGADLIFRVILPGTWTTGSAVPSSTSVIVDGGANFTLNAKVGSILEVTSGPYVGTRRMVTKVLSSTSIQVLPPLPARVNFTYRIEKSVKQFAETNYVEAFTIPFGKPGVVEILDTTGQVQLSILDQATYSTCTLELISGDLPIERGIALRLFRSPVDLEATNRDVLDTVSHYSVPRSLLADPVQGAPFVMLPALPLDDAAYPLAVEVGQGTGFFEGILPRLDVANPPSGVGYLLDFEQKKVTFARRVVNQVQSLGKVGAVQLPDTLVQPSNLTLEVNLGLGYQALTLDSDAILEPNSGTLSFTSEIGKEVVSGVGSLGTNTLTSAEDLSSAQVGDFVVINGTNVVTATSVSSGSIGFAPALTAQASVAFEVRRGKEVLADRFFQELYLPDPKTKVERIRSLGVATNSPRHQVDASRTRVRLAGTFVDLTPVATDGDFTSPSVGVIQVSLATGNLNYATADLGKASFQVVSLRRDTEYRISPELGLVQFVERLLAQDEVLLTYVNATATTELIEEQGRFLVRKELTTHALATSTIPFNPLGRTVADNPFPAVFRGGRPQTDRQVSVSATTSTIAFLADTLPTEGGAYRVVDDLPHGAVVTPDERVYIDYYVYEAIGGENTVSVLNPPMAVAQVNLKEDSQTFTAPGNRVADFPANYALKVGDSQVYIIASAVYDSATDLTTVTLAGQPLQEDLQNPKLYISSGPTAASYFVAEVNVYETLSRGNNRIRVPGDATARYREGTIVLLGGDSYLVASSEVKETVTEITLLQPTRQQYTYGVSAMRRSVRSVFLQAPQEMTTGTSPVLPLRYSDFRDSITVFRQTIGQAGAVLPRTDYEVDPSGLVKLTSPLQDEEEISIWYTGARFIGPGSLRASYTSLIVPSVTNGIAGQVLTASFTTYSPDSFYFRVETMTNYRGELAQKYKAEITSTIPSSGPRTDNMASPKLYTQGRPSLFFDEGAYANEDTVARGVLLFYHDQVNYLEDLLQRMDGRVVGGKDGRLKFDGTAGDRVASFADAENQIDDNFKASPFPIDFTPPLFPIKFRDAYIRAYEASEESRFYPTRRIRTAVTVAGEDTAAVTGDIVADLGQKNITSISLIEKLPPRARVTTAVTAGSTVLQVDTTQFVEIPPLRPIFVATMKVVIQREDGTFIVSDVSPATVQSTTTTSVTLTAPLASPVPAGATIYAAPSDIIARKKYLFGRDLTANYDRGSLHYVTPYPPLDGSVAAVPEELRIQTPASEEVLSIDFTFNNSSTSPEKFPALYGGTTDDDGNESLPTLGPQYEREYGTPSLSAGETTGIVALQGNTTPPYQGIGSLAGGTVITNAVAYPSPAPQVGDLVRILSGVNSNSTFRRIVAVSANTVTVDVPFAADTGFTYQVTVSSSVAAGVASSAGTVFTDLAANFPGAGVLPGHTVVVLTGGAQYQRRQVVSLTTTTLTLDSAFTVNLAGATYRVVKSLNTFSDLTSLTSGSSDLYDILVGNVDSEVGSIDAFFTGSFTDLLSPTTAMGNVTGTTLSGVSVNFLTSQVRVGDYVYVTPTQTNDGIYTVTAVTNATTLEVAQPFSVPSSVTFRVVRPFGVGEQTLLALYDIREQTFEYATLTQGWDQLITTSIPVEVSVGVNDPAYFARGFTSSTLTDRLNASSVRQAALPSIIQRVEGVLSGGDRFYDRRYTWIDTRINLEKGIFVQQGRAVASRIKATQDVLNQLIKLLAVEE